MDRSSSTEPEAATAVPVDTHGSAAAGPHLCAERARSHRPPGFWWKPCAATALTIAIWSALTVVLMSAAAAVEQLTGISMFDDPVAATLLSLAGIAVMLPALLGSVRLIRRRGGTLSSIRCRLRWSWLALCLALSLTYVFTLLILDIVSTTLTDPATATATADEDAAASGAFVGWSVFVPLLAGLVLLVPLQAAAEEYVFRGWLQQTFTAWLRRPWLAISIQSVLFAFAHGLDQVSGFIGLVLFAAALGVLTVRTAGLEAAIALHTSANLLAFSVGGAFGMLDPQVNASSMPWSYLVIDAVALAVYAGAVWAAWLLLEQRRRRSGQPWRR